MNLLIFHVLVGLFVAVVLLPTTTIRSTLRTIVLWPWDIAVLCYNTIAKHCGWHKQRIDRKW